MAHHRAAAGAARIIGDESAGARSRTETAERSREYDRRAVDGLFQWRRARARRSAANAGGSVCTAEATRRRKVRKVETSVPRCVARVPRFTGRAREAAEKPSTL